jgi:hypothetical protein
MKKGKSKSKRTEDFANFLSLLFKAATSPLYGES